MWEEVKLRSALRLEEQQFIHEVILQDQQLRAVASFQESWYGAFDQWVTDALDALVNGTERLQRLRR